MGVDKALLEIKGKAMALLTAGRIAPFCGGVSLVGDPDKYGSLGLPIIPDNFPDEGPVAGIEAALSSTAAEFNLVVACDMPALETAQLESLFNTGADLAIPVHDDGSTEPLCAVYRRTVYEPIRQMFEAGGRRVIDIPKVLESHGFAVRYVRMECSPFANLNTPEDVRSYLHG